MAVFRFGLEKVLEYRRRLVDLRARDLAAAESRAAALAVRIAEVRAEQERCAADGGARADLDVVALAARTAWVARLDRVIAGIRLERATALAAVAAARAALQEAWRDREVLAQLRQRRHTEWQLEQNRREIAELDEIGGLRHARATATGSAG